MPAAFSEQSMGGYLESPGMNAVFSEIVALDEIVAHPPGVVEKIAGTRRNIGTCAVTVHVASVATAVIVNDFTVSGEYSK